MLQPSSHSSNPSGVPASSEPNVNFTQTAAPDTNVTQTDAPADGADLPACACCLGDQHDVRARCDKCNTLTCSPCSWNELRGLCPVCDREQINAPHHCNVCGENVRIGQYMVYDCESCGEEFEACEGCFGNWRAHGAHNCNDDE